MVRRAVILATSFVLACSVGRVDPVPIVPSAPPAVPVKSPARVHLTDGSTAIVQAPWEIRNDSLVGAGSRFDITLQPMGWVHGIPLDSVVGVEAWVRDTDVGASILASVAGAILITGAAAGLAVAIFGSCPTIYSDSVGHEHLEAESFSYAIAPLFEVRDVDRLAAHPDADGVLRLVIRNEAAETHFINHLEVVAVSHAPDEFVAPGPDGNPIALRGPLQLRAHDRLGADPMPLLAAADSRAYVTAPSLLESASRSDVHDTLMLDLPATAGHTAGLVIRGRNSLLTTVLLYELMMAGQGPAAIDWLGRELDDLANVFEVGRWYIEDFGLEVAVETPDGWQPVTRLPDPGPIAYSTMAVPIPVVPGRPTRIRLTFPLDGWRIDQVRAFATARAPATRLVPLSTVRAPDGTPVPAARDRLAASDEQYLETTPGQWFRAEFAGAAGEGAATWFVAAQGWYSEWMRRDWLRTPAPVAFEPGRDRLLETIERWRAGRDSLEAQFASSRFAGR